MNRQRFIFWVVVLLFSTGLVSRAIPLLNVDGRLFKQWVTEDGYLMLTIARNMAIGKGMSIADGTIETNGTQPLVTGVFATAYMMFGGDKTAGIYFAHLWSIMMSLATARVIYLFAKDVLRDSSFEDSVPLLSAGFWFASPSFVPHSMNHLETGTYFFMVALTLWVWYSKLSESESATRYRSALLVGMLLGVTALVRIDAVFLVAAVTIWNVLPNLVFRRDLLTKRLSESIIMGILAVVIVSPWLLNNKLRFGSFTPISGSSQKLDVELVGGLSDYVTRLVKVTPIVTEFVTLILPVPNGWQAKPAIQYSCAAFLIAWGLCHVVIAARANSRQRVLMAIMATLMAAFIVYYSCFFGASYFLPRYLSPGGMPFVVTTCAVVVFLLRKMRLDRSRFAAGMLSAAFMLTVLFHVRIYLTGLAHMHWHVVQWCEEHVSEDTWVAAIQTGTLGYFHDRTINLDGKVNPNALRARFQDRIPQYVADGPAQYLVDWRSILEWRDEPLLCEFEVIVDDPQIGYRGLGVMRRRCETGHVSITR